MTEPAPPHPRAPRGRFTRDPVRIVWVGYAFVQAVLIVLHAAGVTSERVSVVVTGIALAVYVAISELYVRPGYERAVHPPA